MSALALSIVVALSANEPAAPMTAPSEPAEPTAGVLTLAPVTTTGTAPSSTTLTPERAERLRQYQDQRLTIRDETELRGTPSGMTPPLPGPLSSPNVVVVDSFYAVPTWGVYRGRTRVSPTTFLRETGETFRADDLDRRVERDRRKARRWLMVAGAGAATLTAGVVQYERAERLPDEVIAQQLTFGGLALGTTGLLAASFPASRATRLTHYPSAVMDRADAEKMVERHNRALQQALGLSPEDLLLLELADRL